MSEPIIKINDVNKWFGDFQVLKNINLDVNAKQKIVVCGPSGSGKSTLMNIIGCLDSPTGGTYHLNRQEVSTLDGDELAGIRNKEIGFVFQNFHLLARNSALDNVMLPLKYAGVEKSDQIIRAKEVLSQVGLS